MHDVTLFALKASRCEFAARFERQLEVTVDHNSTVMHKVQVCAHTAYLSTVDPVILSHPAHLIIQCSIHLQQQQQ
jgi:hypothetical protein